MSNLFSRSSLRANIVTAAMACLLLVLVACGDGDSSLAPRESEDSSLRHCEDCKDEAISSNKDDVKSSSSVIPKSSDSETSVSSSSTKSSYSSAKADGSEYDAIANMLKDLRDGQTYKTVKIGDQVWMAENLNYKVDSSWCGGGSGENEGDCSKYGRLYTWAAAVGKSEDECGYGKTCGLSGKVRGVCPEGWHLPDNTEWNKLFTAVGGQGTAGKKLKSLTGWKSNGNGTDAYGFSAFPAGGRSSNGLFYSGGYDAYFWSASEINSYYAYYMYLFYINENASLYHNLKDNAFSVRCLKDDP